MKPAAGLWAPTSTDHRVLYVIPVLVLLVFTLMVAFQLVDDEKLVLEATWTTEVEESWASERRPWNRTEPFAYEMCPKSEPPQVISYLRMNGTYPTVTCFLRAPTNGVMSSNLSYAVVIHSAPWHFEKRMAIRETWGEMQDTCDFRVMFVIGTTTNDTVQGKIDVESDEFGDILQYNHADIYFALTIKMLAWLRFMAASCRSECPQIIVKIDDDVVFSPTEVTDFLQEFNSSFKSNLFACYPWYRSPVHRRITSPWYLPSWVFPDSYFPDFCSGNAILLFSNETSRILDEMLTYPYIPVDDVLMTGLVRERIGMGILDMRFRKDLFIRQIKSAELIRDVWEQQRKSDAA